MSATLLVGIDIGGTFTDVVALDTASGAMTITKLPTTPQDQSIAFAEGLRSVAGADAPLLQVLHGTTVATNAILEGKGATIALVTTKGFRHVLEIGRHDIPRKANMFAWVKPQRPVTPERIFELGGRIDVDGSEHEALDEAGLDAIAVKLSESGISAIAVCLLHAYANPAHERQVRDVLLRHMPDARISLSSEVLPVFREYERSMATMLNAYVMPPVGRYVDRLGERLRSDGIAAPLLLMKSSGGVMGVDAVRQEPVQTVLSGPAAGALGAAHIGLAAGFANVISIDIGGTSADVCLIRDGKPALTMRGHVGDWPLQMPMIDMVTIGAGGGSIARVSGGGSLAVGPESAGAVPGPACYQRGGTEPTVTDAHLALGRLRRTLLGESFALDDAAAREAVQARVAAPLGLTLERAAQGILDVVNNAMVGAIRLVSVERGLDPRDFALLAFGGAGPLHGGELARLLGMSTIIIPPHPGVLAAHGLLVADIRNDFSRTCLQRPPRYDIGQVAAGFAALDEQARAWLGAEGIAAPYQQTEWQASLRYRHQGFELTVPWPERRVDDAALQAAIARFHELHEQLYTFSQTDTPVELVTLHVTARGALPRSAPAPQASTGHADATPLAWQRMHVDGVTVECPVYDRAALGVGACVSGPAIIAQTDTTTVLLPGQVARVHASLSLIVTEDAAPA